MLNRSFPGLLDLSARSDIFPYERPGRLMVGNETFNAQHQSKLNEPPWPL